MSQCRMMLTRPKPCVVLRMFINSWDNGNQVKFLVEALNESSDSAELAERPGFISAACSRRGSTTPPWRAPLQRRGIGTTSAALPCAAKIDDVSH